ncbi:hypothetical protein WR25_12358 [Diploscapter pachys]|uniref:Uncharacterized protein n=1 Tax=Diploscapter pachys TaxID=2018661 RepID=A0A2A2M3T3_9BILA|nr:hypothetical protein WR25_12358 [Diploscapter pachys]
MVVGGAGQRHEDGGPTRRGQFRDRRGTGAGDDEVRPGQLLRHVGQIGGEFGRDLMLGILRAHRVDILDPRLMRHLQAAAEGDGQHGEAVGHHLAEDARPLAAAGDEDAEDAVLFQQRIGRSVVLYEVAIASTLPATTRLTRPRTAFCSWTAVGIFSANAASSAGNAG